ncbi:MAG TPA: hypothetical protein VFQ63_02125 [Patescibacteria group bacterium]|nr:hypothetical protein [Patescibacteria group bacterium]
MMQNAYLVLLVDRKHSKMIMLREGSVQEQEEFTSSNIPQRVRHGDDTWDAQDKIDRHIQDHISKHLIHMGKSAKIFADKNHATAVIIGGHQTFFPQIKKHLPKDISEKVKGTFIIDFKAPFNDILERANKLIATIENPQLS